MSFPPIPKYPKAIDDNRSLFLVHNTTETKLREDNQAWAQEISILPVDSDKPDIWADNGFANIEGELLYYDSVEKNEDGKIIKLKNCGRNLGGTQTKFNSKGTWIRSFVVAEHHNQIVDAVIRTEDFVGFNFDNRQETLDWRIRNLEELQVVFDDFACPDVNFTFNAEETNAETGTLASFNVSVTPPNVFSNYRLDFGDGEFTTTEFEGTHRYAVNAPIDPVVTVTNDKCQIIITPIERANPQEPPPQVDTTFDIPIPEVPELPEFNFVPVDVPEPDVVIPPLVFPCLSIEGQLGPIPSVIQAPDINLVSNVVITGPDNPVVINESVVSIISDLPSIIIVDPPIPPTIVIDPPIPPTIVILPPQSSITLALNAQSLPKLEVDWGAPPEMEVALTMAQQVKKPERFAVDPDVLADFGGEGGEFADLFEASGKMKVEYEPVGIPSEIKIIAPDEMPEIKSDIPSTIKVDTSDVNIPDIKIHGPDSPIPNSIKFDASSLPEEIELSYKGREIPVKVDTEVTVKIEAVEIPSVIKIDMPNPIPSIIKIESDIPQTIELKAPDSIMLEIPENAGIPLLLPEEMPQIEMSYKGAPIEVKITLDEVMKQKKGEAPTVMLVPVDCN